MTIPVTVISVFHDLYIISILMQSVTRYKKKHKHTSFISNHNYRSVSFANVSLILLDLFSLLLLFQ